MCEESLLELVIKVLIVFASEKKKKKELWEAQKSSVQRKPWGKMA